MKGLFITFEGCEGSGKSTIAKMLKEELENANIPCLFTREPGGTPISEKIRNIILDPSTPEMTSRTEALLYAASRSQHTAEKIIPALEEGKIVICDRYLESSLAYQGAARELGVGNIFDINIFGGAIEPDYILFFDISPQESLKRIKNRNFDRLEKEELEFHEKVYNYFKSQKNRNNFISIDATKPIDEVFSKVLKIIYSIKKIRPIKAFMIK